MHWIHQQFHFLTSLSFKNHYLKQIKNKLNMNFEQKLIFGMVWVEITAKLNVFNWVSKKLFHAEPLWNAKNCESKKAYLNRIRSHIACKTPAIYHLIRAICHFPLTHVGFTFRTNWYDINDKSLLIVFPSIQNVEYATGCMCLCGMTCNCKKTLHKLYWNAIKINW